MDMLTSLRNYVFEFSKRFDGLKILLLDDETISILNSIITMQELISYDISIINKLADIHRPKIDYLHCLVIVRPTDVNIQLLVAEISTPKYINYNVLFTNYLDIEFMKYLAQHDVHEVISELHEVYLDYYYINNHIFLSSKYIDDNVNDNKNNNKNNNVKNNVKNNVNDKNINDNKKNNVKNNNDEYDRITNGIIALCLSLKVKPCIRYDNGSKQCIDMTKLLQNKIDIRECLWKFKAHDNTVLLVVDRNIDLITPLLSTWTYESMIYEYVGITDNTVMINNKAIEGNNNKTMEGNNNIVNGKKFMLHNDTFFLNNRNNDYGEVCENIDKFAKELEGVSFEGKEMSTFSDIRKCIETLPTYQIDKTSLSNHLHILDIIKKSINFDLSEMEQDIAMNENVHEKLAAYLLNEERVKKPNKDDLIRLLHLIIYTKGSNETIKLLSGYLFDTYHVQINTVHTKRDINIKKKLLDNKIFNVFKAKSYHKYMRHKPLLHEISEQLQKGTLSKEIFPFIANSIDKPEKVIIYMMGGITYSEHSDTYLLGGNRLLNKYSHP